MGLFLFLYHEVTWGIAGIIPGRDDSVPLPPPPFSMTCQVFTTVSTRKKREALLRAKCVALELNKIGRSGHIIGPFAHNI